MSKPSALKGAAGLLVPSYAMKVEYVPPQLLEPLPNARTHSARQLKQIARSIEQFGFNNPILIDDKNRVVAGYGRTEAAKRLGLQQVPVIRLSHLTEQQKRAYIIADNKIALNAGWDRKILAIELGALAELGFDIEITGFETAEIDVLLEEFSVNGPEEAVPAPPLETLAVTRGGDVWQLGPHRLVCGDARDIAAYRALMAKEKAVFVFTDPPYNVEIEGNVTGLGRIRHREFVMASGEMTSQEFADFLETVFRLLTRFSVNGSIHQICMDWRHAGEMIAAGKAAYTEQKNLCVWVKSNAGMGSFYRSRHELIFVFKSGTAPHINTFELGQHGRSRSNVWEYAGVTSFKAERIEEITAHPTSKPVPMVADAIKDCSRRGDIVLDPFGGSGTTLVAAEQCGRRARVIELDPLYCDVIIRRWEKISGEQAILESKNITFAAATAARKSEATHD